MGVYMDVRVSERPCLHVYDCSGVARVVGRWLQIERRREGEDTESKAALA